MKSKSLKILLAGLLMGVGAFAMTACQTTEHTAVVPTQECSVKILTEGDPTSPKKYAEVVIGVANPTVYNVKQIEITWQAYDGLDPLGSPSTDQLDVFVGHGVGGYVAYRLNVDPAGPYRTATSVTIKEARVTKYQTLFETYMAPFIISFVLVGFSLVFFAFEIFRGGLTKEYLANRMREKLASYLIILALCILICLIPLMFSSWVTTLILVGGFVASFVLCGVMALIRLAFVKE